MPRASVSRHLIAGALCVAAAASVQADDKVRLTLDGRPVAAIILPEKAAPDEELAARELAEYIGKISGAPPAVGREVAAGTTPIYVGLALTPDAADRIKVRGTDPASFLLSVKPDAVRLAGLSPQGTLFAAYELLEQLGVRWCMPGPLGTVVPAQKSLSLSVQETIQCPAFSHRLLQAVAMDTVWPRRMRAGGTSYGGHGLPFKADPKARPDLFCEENGRTTWQLRVSHPEVLAGTVQAALAYFRKNPGARYISIAPEDGDGLGTDPWDADDMDPNTSELSVTDRYVKFFNLVLEQVNREFPDAGICFYAYGRTMRVPVREKPNPRILPVFAPIDMCRLHGVDNPICPERRQIMQIIGEWQKLGCSVSYRGYFFNLADQGLPFSMIRQISAEIPYFKKSGIIGCRVECMPIWGCHAPSLYLALKLMWNPNANAAALMADWFDRFYGPAAAPMKGYFDTLESAFYRADYHTGNVFDFPHILTPDVMGALEARVQEAEKLAPAGSEYAGRVAIVRFTQDYGRTNLEMMAALNAFDFAGAKKAYDRAAAMVEESKKFDPVLISRQPTRYLKRFWFGTVDTAFKYTTDGNELAARLPDEWLFVKDPDAKGVDAGWFKPETSTADWKPLKTYSLSWSDQGMRYYKGDAWYRTTVEVPAKFKGRAINLWLGGVDDTPSAWLNGKELPLRQTGVDAKGAPIISKGAAPIGRPWEFVATDAVEFDKPNVLVVRVMNRTMQELGTGGLTGPAMLWAAKPEAGGK